jgi:hypothetical protein
MYGNQAVAGSAAASSMRRAIGSISGSTWEKRWRYTRKKHGAQLESG